VLSIAFVWDDAPVCCVVWPWTKIKDSFYRPFGLCCPGQSHHPSATSLLVTFIIIIIIIIISFMQGIYTYIPETNYVPREYSVAAIVVTIHGAYIVSFSVESIVFLH